MKKTVPFLLFVCFYLFNTAAQAMNVTFVNPGREGERFWDMVTETMRAAAQDFDINLEVVYAERIRERMIKLGTEIASRRVPPDYLILVNEEQSAYDIFLVARQNKVKTFMLLNDFLPRQRAQSGFPGENNPYLLGSLVPDNHSAGRRKMEALYRCAEENALKKPYYVLAIGGDKVTPASIDRNLGAISVIQENKNLILHRFLYANWLRRESETLTDSYLKWTTGTGIRPSLVWAANDPIARGAVTALEKNGLFAGINVCVSGLNWSHSGLEMVQNGKLVTTDGGHFLAGAWSMVILNDYHKGLPSGTGPLPGELTFEMQSIDKSNISEYLDVLGDEDWNKIDFSKFSIRGKESEYRYDFSLENVFKHISSKNGH